MSSRRWSSARRSRQLRVAAHRRGLRLDGGDSGPCRRRMRVGLRLRVDGSGSPRGASGQPDRPASDVDVESERRRRRPGVYDAQLRRRRTMVACFALCPRMGVESRRWFGPPNRCRPITSIFLSPRRNARWRLRLPILGAGSPPAGLAARLDLPASWPIRHALRGSSSVG